MISFPNKRGLQIFPTGQALPITSVGLYTNYTAMALAGRSNTIIGNIVLEGGSGSKIISSAGGMIYMGKVAARTFANVGTTFRIGLQDVGVTGIEDAIFDVYTDIIPPTSLAINSMIGYTMSSGSKTVNHGDRIAVSFEMIARAGADTITLAGNTSHIYSHPYSTVDAGAGPVKFTGTTMLAISIVFDDGTIGWIDGCPTSIVQGLYGVDFAGLGGIDEVGYRFILPFNCTVSRVMYDVTALNSGTGTFSVEIYSDPLGAPVAIASQSAVVANMYTSDGINNLLLTSPINLSANVEYGIVLRNRDAASSFAVLKNDFGHANGIKSTLLGGEWFAIDRAGSSGPFAASDPSEMPALGFYADNIEDPAGGGGGASGNSYTFS